MHRDVQEAMERDAARANEEYRRRERDERLAAYYERIGPALRAATVERHRRTAALIAQHGEPPSMRILDVGCGNGDDLEYLARRGWTERLLAGVEIFEPSVDRARKRLPAATIVLANAAELPFDDGLFDAVLQTTVLSSILAPNVRSAVVSEMFRVVRTGGLVISWDMHSSGGDPNLVGIDRNELTRLFAPSGGSPAVERATLSLAIASRVPASVRPLLAKFPFFLDHLVAYRTRRA